MDQDFQLALTFIKKNEKLFPYTDQEIRERFLSIFPLGVLSRSSLEEKT